MWVGSAPETGKSLWAGLFGCAQAPGSRDPRSGSDTVVPTSVDYGGSMPIARSLAAMSVVVLAAGLGLTGCGSTPTTAPRTVIVTVTGEATATDVASGSDGAASGSTEPGPTSAPTTSESAGPTVDPLAADCAKVLTTAQLTSAFGQLPAGTDRVVEPANPERQIIGRVKCQYGVADDRSAIAVQVVLAQFESAVGAAAQMATTVSSEKTLGAKVSTATVGDQPASVLIRDGGLLVLGYDTWTMSVVIAQGV